MQLALRPAFRRIRALAPVAVTLLTLACGTKNLGSKIAPDDPSATEALGQSSQCTDTGTVAEPYVVDLRGADRSHLEAVMTESIALVRFDCNGLSVLKGCTVKNSAPNPYTFVGVSMKEDQVQIDTLDQLKANLPASAVKLEGELTSGAAIDIGLVMVGRKSVPNDVVTREDLTGPGCEGATHFVRSAIVGAFAVEKGTKGKARVAAEIFKAGVDAGSEANKRVANRDGKPEECGQAKPGDPSPPEQCRAAITIELYPIADEKPVMAEGEAEGGAEKKDEAPKALEAKCPPGMVRAAGKCAPPDQVASFQCKPGNYDECKAQCDRGNAGSCYNYATMIRFDGPNGKWKKDPERAQQLLEKACEANDGPAAACTAASFDYIASDSKRSAALLGRGCDRGDANACSNLGNMLMTGRKDVPKNVDSGIRYLERACGMGSMSGCGSLSRQLVTSKVDPERGRSLLDRSCKSGNGYDCSTLAGFYQSGSLPGGPGKAVDYYTQACDLKQPMACAAAGNLLVEGKKPVKRDPTKARKLFEKGCPAPLPPPKYTPMAADACKGLAELHLTGAGGAEKSAAQAETVLKRGCTDKMFMTCAELANLYFKGGKGLNADPAKGEALLRQRCDATPTDFRSCEALGKHLETTDKGIARAFYEQTCTRTKMPSMCSARDRLSKK